MANEQPTASVTFHASPYQTGLYGVWYEAPEHPSTKYDWAFDCCDLNKAQATTLAAAMSRKFDDLDTVDWDWVYKTGMAIGACDNCASEDFGDCPSCHLSTGFGCGHGAICDACESFGEGGEA